MRGMGVREVISLIMVTRVCHCHLNVTCELLTRCSDKVSRASACLQSLYVTLTFFFHLEQALLVGAHGQLVRYFGRQHAIAPTRL